MNQDAVRIWILLLEAVVCVPIAVRAFLCLKNHRKYIPAAFFTCAAVSFLINDLYWIAFYVLEQEARIPFSVADFSENGTMLLLAAMLFSAFPDRGGKRNRLLVSGAMLFSLCNIVLWILWSGEWLKDILGGFCFAVFCWQVARSLWESRALSRREWSALGIGCALLMAVLWIEQLDRDLFSRWFAWLYYCLMIAVFLFFVVRWLRTLRDPARGDAAFSLAAAGIFWTLTCVYMCAEPAWFIAELAIVLMIVIMLVTLERQAEGK